MTSPSFDPDAVDRLRRRTGASLAEAPGPDPDRERPPPLPGWFEGDDWSDRLRSFRRRLFAPAEQRVRREVRAAVARHDSELSREVADLRAELIRTRTEHAAEIAALQEQLRNRS